MPYTTLQPPFTLKFREMSGRELKEYFRWFTGQIPERIGVLGNAVKETPGFQNWQPDRSPSSLDPLGDWYASQIETRPRTAEELQAIKARSSIGVEALTTELTNRTFSLAVDVGMYLSKVLQKEHLHLTWEQPLNDKKFVDFGQPVLVGFGAVPLNPVRILTTLAYGIASKKHTGRRLREVFDYWSKQAKSQR